MTSTVKAELKPCPFCGGHAILIYDNQEGYQIYCDDGVRIIQELHCM